MQELIESFVGSNGLAVQILSIVGIFRLVMKPASEVISIIVANTPTKKDDEFVSNLKQNALFKKFVFLVDWLVSIKIKK